MGNIGFSGSWGQSKKRVFPPKWRPLWTDLFRDWIFTGGSPCAPAATSNAVDLRICVLSCHVIPEKAGSLKLLKKLDSPLRGNDVKVLLHWLGQPKSTA